MRVVQGQTVHELQIVTFWGKHIFIPFKPAYIYTYTLYIYIYLFINFILVGPMPEKGLKIVPFSKIFIFEYFSNIPSENELRTPLIPYYIYI